MSTQTDTGTRGVAFLAAVIAIGLAVIATALIHALAAPPGLEWLTLAALTLLTGSFTVKVPSLSARFSVSETFVFASGLLFGPAAGTLTVVLDALVISFWLKKETRSLRKVLFNIAAPSIGFWLAATAFFALADVSPGEVHQRELYELIGPLFAFAFLYFLINTWLVAGALAWERDLRASTVWFGSFAVFGINYFVGCSVATLLVAYTSHIDLTAVSIIVPLLLISYLTFRTSMGRLDDAERHVAQVSELYMATIETLAMAVDAKDQITHGHIRRVQVYALELSKRLGVTDERQLKAIAAAALLHDMGKLAIPEHILNKPGRLTAAEFDRMKQHAGLGADLLSSVRFPYPVVPIVRHHHENWNGTGYPSGIAATDIPLGARILAVVDCFDALTSDRPYRPRLSPEDAFEILRERRGAMYDPLVVDTFVRSYPEIAPAAIKAGQEARSIFPVELSERTEREPVAPLSRIRVTASESALLIACSQSLLRSEMPGDAVATASQYLRQLTPATVFAIYKHVPDTDQLVCEWEVGDPEMRLRAFSIRLGERVSGWCGANRRTAINADASLDLGQTATLFQPALRSTISSAAVTEDRLAGVLTAYSPKEEAFHESHRYGFERIAQLLFDRIVATSRVSPRHILQFPKHGS